MIRKTVLVVFLITVLLSGSTHAKVAKDKSNEWRYDIECAGNGVHGSYLVKVWVYANKGTAASDLIKKSAVHGVLFKGFSGREGCTSQRPLATSPSVQEEKADFFSKFFADQSDFLKYATIVSQAPEVVKMGKNDFKVGMVVTVSKDQLRKDLESAGVIKSLSSGF